MKRILVAMLIFIGVVFSVKSIQAQESKFTNHTEGGILPYDFSFDEVAWSVQTFNGYRSNLALGGTIGFEKYHVDEIFKYSVIPVSAGLRYDVAWPPLNKIFLALESGYGFAWEAEPALEGEIKGGFRFNPQAGVKFKLGEGKYFMTLGVGYQYQKFQSNYTTRRIGATWYTDILYFPQPVENYLEKRAINTHRFSLKLGIGF